MKTLFVHLFRILSCVALPLGVYLILSPTAVDSLTSIFQPIIPTSLTSEIMVIVILILFPVLIILFLQPIKNPPPISGILLGFIQKPTLKNILLNLLLVIFLIIVGASQYIFWGIIVLMLTSSNPACGTQHLADIFGIVYHCVFNL
jgi:hypothetical protein